MKDPVSEQVVAMLRGGNAHVGFEEAIAVFPANVYVAVADAGLDFAELMYVAEQRALRAVVLQFRGQAALEALKDDPIVALDHTERAAQMLYMGMYLDGITIGYRAARDA